MAKAQAISLAARYTQMQVVDVEQARGRQCKVLFVRDGSLVRQGESASILKLLMVTKSGPERKMHFNAALRQNSSKGEWLV